MSLISAHGLEKSHGPHHVLAGVTVTVADGERIGLVGNNGSGKSTLCRILAGVDAADVGEVMTRRGARIGYLDQVPVMADHENAVQVALGGLESWQQCRTRHEVLSQQLAEGGGDAEALMHEQAEVAAEIERLGGWDQEHRVISMLERLKISDLKAPVVNFSGGEKRRVSLARLLVSQPDVLILDEPTNHLDTDCIDWLEQYLQDSFKGALVLITHDRYFLDRAVNRTWEIADGQVRSYEGGWEAYLTAKAEREAVEARTESNRQNFLRTELEWLRRQPKARGTKQKARTDRALEALSVTSATDGSLDLQFGSVRQGSEVATLQGVGMEFGDRVLFSDLDLIVVPSQRIGILGANGSGKTTLLKIITGELKPTSGTVRRGQNAKVAYFSQTRTDLDASLTIAENVAGRRQDLVVGGVEITVFSYLGRFLFRGEELRKKVGTLSGGEKARVALAKLLLLDANLLILDEPTNDLDVSTLGSLEQMVRQFRGCVLVVTHDRYFLDRVATDVLAFEDSGEISHTVGDYSTYIRLKKQRILAAKAASEPARSTNSPSSDSQGDEARVLRPSGSRPAKLSYKENKELEGIEAAIEAAETEVARLQEQLADPQLYRTDAARASRLSEQLEAAQSTAATLMDRWQELESKKEAFEASRN